MQTVGLGGAAIAVLVITGYAIMKLILPREARLNVYERIPLAFALGAGWASLSMFGVSLLGMSAFLPTLALSVLVCVMALAVSVHRHLSLRGVVFAVLRNRSKQSLKSVGNSLRLRSGRGFAALTMPRQFTVKTLLRIGLMVLLGWTIFIVTLAAMQSDLGWMGLAIWGIKSRAAFLYGRMPLEYFGDFSRQWSHLNYPLLLPLTETWLYQFMGQVNEQAVKVLFPTSFVCLIGLFYGGLRHLDLSSEFGLLFTALLGTIPLLMFESITGNADVLLALFVLGSTLYLFRWLREGASSDLVLAAILSALGAWVKNEGMVHWAVNLFGLMIFGCLCRQSRPVELVKVLVAFVILSFVLLGPWQILLRFLRVPDNDFAPVAFDTALANVGRVPTIVTSLVAHFLALQYWGSFWLMFFIGLVWHWRKMRRDPARGYLAFAVLFPLGLLACAFLFSIWEPFTFHIDTALPRLMLHTAPAAALFVALQFEELDRFLSESGSGAIHVS